jgi:membrane protein DedA with SNARE-associated domain
MDKAGAFLDKWGFVGIPVSFLTIGFQTMVNASAGYSRMRWDLYTVAMVPGCVMWAIVYGGLGLTIYSAFVAAPWLSLAALIVLVALTFGLTRLRRNAGSVAHTPR